VVDRDSPAIEAHSLSSHRSTSVSEAAACRVLYCFCPSQRTTGFYDGQESDSETHRGRDQEIREKTLGPDHPDLAAALNGLGSIYTRQGKYEEAEPLYKRALEIQERALAPDHLSLAYSLHGLGSVYRDQQRFADAESLYKRALAIREKTLEPDHPDLVLLRNSYATLLRATGRDEEADALTAVPTD